MHLSQQHLKRILLIALVLRLALPVASWLLNGNTQRFYQPDSATYLLPAQEWLNTGQYSTTSIPELMRPPGYALFLMPGIITHHITIVTIALQIILSLCTIYLTIKITEQITSHLQAQKWVGYFAALEPLSILYTSQLLTETLFTTLTTAALYTLLKSQQSQKTILIAAILYASATYVRPIGYYLPLAILIPLIYTRTPIKRIAIFLLIALGLPGLWQMRNFVVANYTSFSAISSINLYFYQSAAVTAKIEGLSFYEHQKQLGYGNKTRYIAAHPNQQDWSPAQQYRYMSSAGIQTILKNPVTYAQIHIQGILRTLFDPGAVDVLKLLNAYPKKGGLLGRIVDQGLLKTVQNLLTNQPLIFFANLFLGCLLLGYYTCALFTLTPNTPKSIRPLLFCLITCFYFIVLSGGPHSLNRFRHPIMPIVAILAGIGCTHQQAKIKKYLPRFQSDKF